MTTGATNSIRPNRPAMVDRINAPRSAAGLASVASQHEAFVPYPRFGSTQRGVVAMNTIPHIGAAHALSLSRAPCIASHQLDHWSSTQDRSPDATPSLRNVALSELRIRALPQRCYPEGTEIIGADAQTRSVYFIVEGRVRLYRLSPVGEEVFYSEIGAGDCLVSPPWPTALDPHSRRPWPIPRSRSFRRRNSSN